MVPGAVHGLIHHDRRHLDSWSLTVTGHELRPLAATTPTPFHAVFVSRATSWTASAAGARDPATVGR